MPCKWSPHATLSKNARVLTSKTQPRSREPDTLLWIPQPPQASPRRPWQRRIWRREERKKLKAKHQTIRAWSAQRPCSASSACLTTWAMRPASPTLATTRNLMRNTPQMASKSFKHSKWLSRKQWGKVGVSIWSSSQFTRSTISVVISSPPTLQRWRIATINKLVGTFRQRSSTIALMMATLRWAILHLNSNNRRIVQSWIGRVAAREWRFQKRMWLMICVRVSCRGRLAAWPCRRRPQSLWLKTSRLRASTCGRRTSSPSTHKLLERTQTQIALEAAWVRVPLESIKRR